MDQEEQLVRDWYVRYYSIFRKRYTKKQKNRFLESLTADIRQFRSDVKLDTFKLHEKDSIEYKNLYVGDIKKAETIICTYYDTPAVHLGPYRFFDVEHRKKSSMTFILLSSLAYILFGGLFTWLIGILVFQSYSFWSFPSVLCILFYGLYFMFLGKVTKGWPGKYNLIRNTSSLLAQLLGAKQIHNKRAAFAFLDAGCTNNAGLDKLLKSSKAKVYHLDSVGASQPLYQVMKNGKSTVTGNEIEIVEHTGVESNRLVYIISGRKEEKTFFLSKNDLKQRELSEQNMNQVSVFMKQAVGRKQ